MSQPTCEERITAAIALLADLRDSCPPSMRDEVVAVMEELQPGSGSIDNPG